MLAITPSIYSAHGGSRTHTDKPADSKSTASANSATQANLIYHNKNGTTEVIPLLYEE